MEGGWFRHHRPRRGVAWRCLAAVLGTMTVTVACSFAIFFSSGRSTLRICAEMLQSYRAINERVCSPHQLPPISYTGIHAPERFVLTAGGVLTACLGAMGFHHFTLHLRQVLEEHMHCIVQEPASGRAWPWGAAFASLFASAYGACVLMVLTVSISLEDHTLIHGGCALLFFLCLIYHLFAVHFLLWKGSAALARAGRDPHALHAPHGLRLRHCCSAAYVGILLTLIVLFFGLTRSEMYTYVYPPGQWVTVLVSGAGIAAQIRDLRHRERASEGDGGGGEAADVKGAV